MTKLSHQLAWPGRLIVLVTIGWMWTAFAQETSVAEDELVAIQAGELPIILSAPHGGTREIAGVPPREGTGLPTGGSGFVTGRDVGTAELAQEVAAAVERRFGKKPYFVIAHSHRKYLDPNRPPHIAYEDPDAKPAYDRYHGTVAGYCRDVQQKFRTGLLLDIHGQSSAKDTVFRGTKNGLTVSLLRERYGDAAHDGPESLFALLKSRGWKVHPDPFDGREQSGFTGGYIVQTYGSHQGYGIDAMQLEFGMDYRGAESRQRISAALADVVGEYAQRYLTVKPLAITEEQARAAERK
jgi:N-formylglutamate amidohydrolase